MDYIIIMLLVIILSFLIRIWGLLDLLLSIATFQSNSIGNIPGPIRKSYSLLEEIHELQIKMSELIEKDNK